MSDADSGSASRLTRGRVVAVSLAAVVAVGALAWTFATDDTDDEANANGRGARTLHDGEGTNAEEVDLRCEHPFLPAEVGTSYRYSGALSTEAVELVLTCDAVSPSDPGYLVEWAASARTARFGIQRFELRTRCVPGEGAEVPLDALLRAAAQIHGAPTWLVPESLDEGSTFGGSQAFLDGVLTREYRAGAIGQVTPPAGVYDAVELVLDETLVTGGETVESRTVYWLAEGVGVVRAAIDQTVLELEAVRQER